MELGDLEQDLVSRCEAYLQQVHGNTSTEQSLLINGVAVLTFACILRRADFVKLILEQGIEPMQSLDNTLEDTFDLVAIHSPFQTPDDTMVATLQLLLGRIQPTAFNLQNAIRANQVSAARVYLQHTNGALAFEVSNILASNEITHLLNTWRVATEIWAVLTARTVPHLGLHSALRRLPVSLLGRLVTYMLI